MMNLVQNTREFLLLSRINYYYKLNRFPINLLMKINIQ
jgi:hypothetical protein